MCANIIVEAKLDQVFYVIIADDSRLFALTVFCVDCFLCGNVTIEAKRDQVSYVIIAGDSQLFDLTVKWTVFCVKILL